MDTSAFEALSDERRLGIVRLLASGEKCVCEVSSALEMSDALASHHLKSLREAGLVLTRRKGRWLYCRLDPSALSRLAEDLSALSSESLAAEARAGSCCGALIDAITERGSK